MVMLCACMLGCLVPTRRAPSVRIEFLQIADLAHGSSHLFDSLHLFQGRLHGFGGCLHGGDGGVAGLLGGAPSFLTSRPCRLSRLAKPLMLLTHGFQGISLLVAELARFLGEAPEAFGFLPGGLDI